MQTNDISQNVIEKIKKGQVKMKPKALFALQTFFLIFLAFLASALAVFFTSFIGFALRVKGFSPLLAVVFLAVILFVIFAFIFSKKFPSFYKKPLVFGLVIILLAIGIVSLAVFLTPLHQRIMNYSQLRNVPLISPLYKCGCGCGTNHICGLPKNIESQPSCGCSGNSSLGGSCKK